MLRNRIGQLTTTVGTGDLLLGAAITDSLNGDFQALGATDDGLEYDILIVEGASWEIATDCVYTHATSSLTRGTLEETSTGSILSLTGTAKVYVAVTAARLTYLLAQAAAVAAHIADTANPHSVTYAQVGAEAAGATATHAALAATHAGLTASQINNAAGKTTPVNADELGLWDSVASTLKKLTWSNLVTTLKSVFVVSAGQSGGQTIIGGTGASENLTLQSTSHATRGAIVLANGTERVGVGTTTPNSKMHIAGVTSNDVLTLDVGLNLRIVDPAPALTPVLLTAAGNVDEGRHYYAVTYYTALGETEFSPTAASWVVCTASQKRVSLTLPISADARVIGRRIYRTPATSGTSYWVDAKLVVDITNNTETTYEDNIADAALSGSNQFYRENATVTYFTVNGVAAAIISNVNTIVGKNAGASIIAGTAASSQNTLIGVNAGASLTTGAKLVAVGVGAGRYNTSGVDGVFIGWEAGFANTTGTSNIAIGRGALRNNSSSHYNVVIGNSAAQVGTALTNTVALGFSAGINVTGAHNTLIGAWCAPTLTSGTGNIIIGRGTWGDAADVPSAATSNFLNIGNLIYGDLSANKLVGLNTTTPTAPLDVAGNTIRLRTARTPASASAAGNQGDIAWDSSYFYVCTATNTWRRIAHTTW